MLMGSYKKLWLLQEFHYFISFQFVAGSFLSSSSWYFFKEQSFFNIMVLKSKFISYYKISFSISKSKVSKYYVPDAH